MTFRILLSSVILVGLCSAANAHQWPDKDVARDCHSLAMVHHSRMEAAAPFYLDQPEYMDYVRYTEYVCACWWELFLMLWCEDMPFSEAEHRDNLIRLIGPYDYFFQLMPSPLPFTEISK